MVSVVVIAQDLCGSLLRMHGIKGDDATGDTYLGSKRANSGYFVGLTVRLDPSKDETITILNCRYHHAAAFFGLF